jgi:hypothetical protein
MTITDVRDLEIGHILSQARDREIDVDVTSHQTIRVLTDIRNKLSHLEPLPEKLLFCPEIERTLRGATVRRRDWGASAR